MRIIHKDSMSFRSLLLESFSLSLDVFEKYLDSNALSRFGLGSCSSLCLTVKQYQSHLDCWDLSINNDNNLIKSTKPQTSLLIQTIPHFRCRWTLNACQWWSCFFGLILVFMRGVIVDSSSLPTLQKSPKFCSFLFWLFFIVLRIYSRTIKHSRRYT